MKTNLEKYNFYFDEIKKKEQKFIDKYKDSVPKKIYSVYPSGKIRTLNVVNFYYKDGFFCKKKPTRKEVTEIKDYYENIPEFKTDNLLISLESFELNYKVSTAINYKDLNKYYETYDEAKSESDKIIEIKNKEKELLNNGYIQYAYCDKVVPEEESVNYEIIFQNSKPDPFSKNGYKKFVDKQNNKYCSKKCGVHDQMAHEG